MGNATPAVNNLSTYDVNSGLLTLKGTGLTNTTQTQLRTVSVDGVALDSYSPVSSNLIHASKGSLDGDKYRIKNDGTELWVQLTPADKKALKDKGNLNSDGSKTGKITATGSANAWGGLNNAKALVVTGNTATVNDSSTYDITSNILTLKGTGLQNVTNTQLRTVTVDDVALDSYTATNPKQAANTQGLAADQYRVNSDGTELWIKLTTGGDNDAKALEDKSGNDANGLKDNKLGVASGNWGGLSTTANKDLRVLGNTATTGDDSTYEADKKPTNHCGH